MDNTTAKQTIRVGSIVTIRNREFAVERIEKNGVSFILASDYVKTADDRLFNGFEAMYLTKQMLRDAYRDGTMVVA